MSISFANPWPWFAVAVLGLVAIADGSLVIATRHARPTAVEEHPWLASAGFDAAKAARARFTAAGLRFAAVSVGAGDVRCAITPTGSGIGPAMITAYRPDDGSLDRRLAWTDSARATIFSLPRAGWWKLRVEGADGANAAEIDVEVRP